MKNNIDLTFGKAIIEAGYIELIKYLIIQSKEARGISFKKMDYKRFVNYLQLFTNTINDLCVLIDSKTTNVHNVLNISYKIKIPIVSDNEISYDTFEKLIEDPEATSSILDIDITIDNDPIKFIDFVKYETDTCFQDLWNIQHYNEMMRMMESYNNIDSNIFSIYHAILYLSYLVDVITMSICAVADSVVIDNADGDVSVIMLPYNRMAKSVYANTIWTNIANNLCQLVYIDDDGVEYPIILTPKFFISPNGYCNSCNCTIALDET